MAQTVTIIVYPSGADTDALTVSDAMRQVLDAFELLSTAEARREGGDQTIVWKLERASANSPFSVVGSAIPADPTANIDDLAAAVSYAFRDGIERLIRADRRASWIDERAETITRRLLQRNMNGVGRTDILVSDFPPVIINHRAASTATRYLDRLEAERAAKQDDLTCTEYGSIEGHLTDLTTHYAKPAVMLRTRISREDVKCVLPDEATDAIGLKHNWRDVWRGRRVLVSGAIHYNQHGKMSKVDALHIEYIETSVVSVSQLQALSFPEASSPSEYISRIWGEVVD